jgi:hypothetical protein
MDSLDASTKGMDAVQFRRAGVLGSRVFGALLTAASLLFDANPAHGAEAAPHSAVTR